VSWRAICERMFKRGPDSFSQSERETIRNAIEEAYAAGAASALRHPEPARALAAPPDEDVARLINGLVEA
jgi:hypothetical protein